MSERTYAPRPGGRAVAQRGTATSEGTGARGARRHPIPGVRTGERTQGTAALKVDPATVTEPVASPRLRVAPPAPVSAPRAPFVAGMIAVVIAGVLGILLVNTKTNENSFEISRLQDEQTTLDNQQQQLENQLANFESVGNLDALAKAQGLVKGKPAWIRLPDGKIIGVPKPATGEPAVTAQDEADAKGAAGPAQPADGAVQPAAGTGTAADGTVQPAAGTGTAADGAVQPGGTPLGSGQ